MAVAIVCVLIGIGAVAVVRGQQPDEFLASAREPDLVRLLDDLQAARPASTARSRAPAVGRAKTTDRHLGN